MHRISNVPNPKNEDSERSLPLSQGRGQIISPTTNSRQDPTPKPVISQPRTHIYRQGTKAPEEQHIPYYVFFADTCIKQLY